MRFLLFTQGVFKFSEVVLEIILPHYIKASSTLYLRLSILLDSCPLKY